MTADASEEQCVAIGHCPGRQLGTDDPARTRSVVDDDGLTKSDREALRNKAGHRIVATAGSEWDDQPYGSARVLGSRRARDEGGQHEKPKERNVHLGHQGVSCISDEHC